MRLAHSAAALAALALMAAAGAASAQTYAEATVAYSSSPDLGWGGPILLDYEMDEGILWGVAVGHRFSPNFAVEAEITTAEAEYSCCTPNNVNVTNYMVNAFYTFRPDASIRPYVGAGLGMVDIEYEAAGKLSDNVFGWQAMAGLEMPVSPRVSLFGEYRYLKASEAEDSGTMWEYESHNIGLGLRYNF
jgi:opacity protein-like surface antigen